MIETSDQLEEISTKTTADGDIPSLKYISPSEVADIHATRELAYELYTDEDTRKWSTNSSASVVLGANAVLVAIVSGLLYNHVSNPTIVIIVFPLVVSIFCAIFSLKPRNSKRPKITGDTAEKLDLSKDEFAGVLAYSYAYDFFYNKEMNDKKMWWLKIALFATSSSFPIAVIAAVVLLVDLPFI